MVTHYYAPSPYFTSMSPDEMEKLALLCVESLRKPSLTKARPVALAGSAKTGGIMGRMSFRDSAFMSGGAPKSKPGEAITPQKKGGLRRKAETLLRNPKIRRVICEGLRGLSSDLETILKQLVKLMLPLALILPDPYLYAMLALLLSRFGIATFCSGQAPSKARSNPAVNRTRAKSLAGRLP